MTILRHRPSLLLTASHPKMTTRSPILASAAAPAGYGGAVLPGMRSLYRARLVPKLPSCASFVAKHPNTPVAAAAPTHSSQQLLPKMPQVPAVVHLSLVGWSAGQASELGVSEE